MFLSILKRERERFPLFVPRHYCVPTRTFRTVCMIVSERSMSEFDRLMGVFDSLRPFYDQKSTETVRNDREHWTA